MLKNIKYEVLIIAILFLHVLFLTNFEIILFNYFLFFQETLGHISLKQFFEKITVLGQSSWYFTISLIFILFGFLLRKNNILINYHEKIKKIEYINFIIFFSVFFSGVLTQIIKHIVGRQRPSHLNYSETGFYLDINDYTINFFTFDSNFHSFPSGHTSTVFALVLVLSLLVPKLKYFLFLLAMLIAYSRIALGAHYLTDVLGGVVVALIGFKLTLYFVPVFFKNYKVKMESFYFKMNFNIALLALFLISIILSIAPIIDVFINNVFFLGMIQGYGFQFFLQSQDYVVIFFRKIMLFLIILYVFLFPLLSKFLPFKFMFFNFNFKIKDILFIWVSSILSLIVIVNLVLKNMWGRVRPNDILEFGGDGLFTPWYKISDQCGTNCSFVSGDAAVGFSLIVFYFLIKKEFFLWAALFFGFGFGLIRMMEGGHFFSDIVFAGLFVFLFSCLFYSFYNKTIKGGANTYLFITCILLVLLKLISVAGTDFDLYGDEAQYWLWSKEFAFGYYSKPPLLSWLIGLVTMIFGNNLFVLKAIPLLIYCLTSYLIFVLASKLYANKNLAICCGLTFFLLPAVSLSSFLVSTDILLVFLWSASLIQLIRTEENPSLFNFVFLGSLLGFAFLAKYAAIYFILSTILLIIFEKNYRRFFNNFKFKFILSFLIILLIVSPNIFWNYQNQWLTFGHTAKNASLDDINLNFFGLIEFLTSQILMLGPILFFCFIFFFFKKINIGSKEKFLLYFSLPSILIVSLESFLVKANANWAAVSLISLMILFVHVVYKYSKNVVYINNYINLTIGAALFIIIGISYPLSSFDRINGVKNFYTLVDEKKEHHIKNIVVGDRLLFANLNFEYANNSTAKITFFYPFKPGGEITNHFQLSNPLPRNFSKNFILIGSEVDVSYLYNYKYLKDFKKIKLIGSGSFPFVKEKLNIYEVLFDEIISY